MPAEAFLDSNVLLYAVSADRAKAEVANLLLGRGAVVSVQVLNEFSNVMSRKHRKSWPEIAEALEPLKAVLDVRPLTVEIHEAALFVATRYGYSFFDSLLVAAALTEGCTTFYSEDLHNGQVIEGRLTIRNPFVA